MDGPLHMFVSAKRPLQPMIMFPFSLVEEMSNIVGKDSSGAYTIAPSESSLELRQWPIANS